MTDNTMTDVLGAMVSIGDWVAFYKTAKGKSLFGKVISFNKNTMVILPNNKGNTVTKTSVQVFKVPTELMENKKISITDAVGNELKVGNWVVTTYSTGYIRGYGGTYQGKIVFGKIEKLSKASLDIKVKTRTSMIKKQPTQVVQLTDEQAMLRMFIEG